MTWSIIATTPLLAPISCICYSSRCYTQIPGRSNLRWKGRKDIFCSRFKGVRIRKDWWQECCCCCSGSGRHLVTSGQHSGNKELGQELRMGSNLWGLPQHSLSSARPVVVGFNINCHKFETLEQGIWRTCPDCLDWCGKTPYNCGWCLVIAALVGKRVFPKEY